MRYSIWTIAALISICLVRFSFLDGGKDALHKFFYPSQRFYGGFIETLVFVANSVGAGCGSIISLASYNKFQTNIMSYSWIICAGQVVIIFLFGLISFLLDAHMDSMCSNNLFTVYKFDLIFVI